jgi:GAF domain-containing protein
MDCEKDGMMADPDAAAVDVGGTPEIEDLFAAQNAQVVAQMQDRAREMASLYRMASTFSSAVDLDQMLAVVLDQVRSVLCYDSCLISLATADGQALRVEAVDRSGQSGAALPDVAALVGLEVPLDRGINAWIFREGEPLRIHDANLDPRRLHIEGHTDGIRAALGAPLVVDGETIGTIYATRSEPGSFTSEQLDFLTITASQVAAAVQRTRLLDRACRRAEELETLLSIAAAIASTLDVDAILQTLYEQAGRVMDTSSFFVALYDENTGALSFPLLYNLGERRPAFSVGLHEGTGLCGYVIQQCQSLLIRDWAVEGENVPVEPTLLGEPSRSWLCVPIMVRGDVLGVLGARSDEPYAFTVRHERLLAGMASQAGISLQNARLVAELKLVNTDLEEMVKTQAHLLDHIEEMAVAIKENNLAARPGRGEAPHA